VYDLVLTVDDADGPGAPPLQPGQMVTYLITAGNRGPGEPQEVTVHITLPPQTTFQGFEAPPGWSCAPGTAGGIATVVCVAPPGAAIIPVVAPGAPAGQDPGAASPLPVGAQVTFRLVVQVNRDARPGEVVRLAAVVAGRPREALLRNNPDLTARPVVVPRPPVGLPRTGGAGAGVAGEAPAAARPPAGLLLGIALGLGGLTLRRRRRAT
jgi:uncharacterized repeat protein (TIGR01451 family)